MSDLTIRFTVDQTPAKAFAAIKNVAGWWSEDLVGKTTNIGDEFEYRYKAIHYSKQKLTELVPDQLVVWLVEDGYLNFVTDRQEWRGTQLRFEVAAKGDKTEVTFTHIGLAPTCECFEMCSKGWDYYINESLKPLITTGIGKPNPEALEAS